MFKNFCFGAMFLGVSLMGAAETNAGYGPYGNSGWIQGNGFSGSQYHSAQYYNSQRLRYGNLNGNFGSWPPPNGNTGITGIPPRGGCYSGGFNNGGCNSGRCVTGYNTACNGRCGTRGCGQPSGQHCGTGVYRNGNLGQFSNGPFMSGFGNSPWGPAGNFSGGYSGYYRGW